MFNHGVTIALYAPTLTGDTCMIFDEEHSDTSNL